MAPCRDQDMVDTGKKRLEIIAAVRPPPKNHLNPQTLGLVNPTLAGSGWRGSCGTMACRTWTGAEQ